MKKLCIFDLDGTLASTLESMAVAANRVLRELGLPEQPTESFKYFAGDGRRSSAGAVFGLPEIWSMPIMKKCTGNTGSISVRPACTRSFLIRGSRSFWKS
ncbi:MAG: HAD hydrolase-like protein [Lachnospiraceae bacterium]